MKHLSGCAPPFVVKMLDTYMTRMLSLGALLLVSSAGALACGSDDNPAAGGSGGAGGGAGSGASGGAGGSSGGSGGSGGGPSCDKGPGYHDDTPPAQVDLFDGKVIDLDGNPLADVQTTVCGVDICSELGTTNAAGDVVTCESGPVGVCKTGIAPGFALKKPAFKYGLGLSVAKFALLLPPGQTSYDVGEQSTAKFPPFSAGQPLVAGAEAANGPARIKLEPGTVMKFEFEFVTAEERRFRAVEIPSDKAPDAVDASLGFAWLVATTPTDTSFCPKATLVLDNSGSLAAGADVELWLHGVKVEEEWAPYGGWAKVSDAKVSADGSNIETVPGQGVPLLGTYGVRLKP